MLSTIFRIDKEFFLQNLDSDQAKRMFYNFFPSATTDVLNDMGRMFEEIKSNHPVSPAAFENFLSRCETGADDAVNRLDELEKHLKNEKMSQDDNKTTIYRIKGYDKKWEPSGEPRGKGNWEALVHKTDTKQKLLNDVTTFLQNRQLYRTHGLPFRRLYLFHGPRGAGKVSLVHSLAGKLNYSICHLNMTEKDLTVDSLIKFMGEVPSKCLILIENIDDAFPSPKRRGDVKALLEEQGCEIPKPKMSTLEFCYAIESFQSETSPIVILTAKDKEDLAPDVLLPGR